MDWKETGEDTYGNEYPNIETMWASEVNNAEEQAATISGVLGGLEEVHETDISFSRAFLQQVMHRFSVGTSKAVDCGGGIGRVTKHLLLPLFDSLDLVEQCRKYIEAAQTFLQDPKVAHYYCMGLQDFVPQPKAYDVVWIQWVLPYLTDVDVVAFLDRMKVGLRNGGLICVKENVKDNGFFLHKDDYSVTRSKRLYERLFANAGLKVVTNSTQTQFPADLYTVKLWALQPQD